MIGASERLCFQCSFVNTVYRDIYNGKVSSQIERTRWRIPTRFSRLAVITVDLWDTWAVIKFTILIGWFKRLLWSTVPNHDSQVACLWTSHPRYPINLSINISFNTCYHNYSGNVPITVQQSWFRIPSISASSLWLILRLRISRIIVKSNTL